MTILSPVNSRAKLPADLRAFCKEWGINPRDLLSTNPKTEKSEVQTYILHLAPADTSGFNVCANAQNCKKICLHFAGNPVYMNAKQAARIRRTQAFMVNPSKFAETLILSILTNLTKQPDTEPIAVRPNGTSDICWENVGFTLSPEFSRLLNVKYGLQGNYAVPSGWTNIFEFFQHAERMNGRRLVYFYDYTKLSRNWKRCAELGYHLTFSFDGWNNPLNLRIAKRAIENGVNIAAAFMVKRGKPLPSLVDVSRIMGGDNVTLLPVLDGDKSDFRPGDLPGGYIVGLRFKLPHGIQYSDADKAAFCM